MALVQATLSANLQAIADSTDEPTARAAMAKAFGDYLSLAMSNGLPMNPGIATAAETAMEAALAGMSAAGAGATSG